MDILTKAGKSEFCGLTTSPKESNHRNPSSIWKVTELFEIAHRCVRALQLAPPADASPCFHASKSFKMGQGFIPTVPSQSPTATVNYWPQIFTCNITRTECSRGSSSELYDPPCNSFSSGCNGPVDSVVRPKLRFLALIDDMIQTESATIGKVRFNAILTATSTCPPCEIITGIRQWTVH
ncbi:hypothetical protein K438DRAFT_2022836 [Mycena galopus ATCC 62051]|nr:hypothetical protein K438DRAFT_2022836 [Mycena galopus ATCC 62051]